MFFLMGGPMLFAEKACINAGIRSIDVRHEQAAAMMAHAYSRTLGRPGVCMACSGPGTLNLGTGLAHALMDRSEEHTSELQSLMRISYAVTCLNQKRQRNT